MGIVYKIIEGQAGEALDRFFNRKNGYIELFPGNVILPKKYCDIGEEILNVTVRDNDIWTLSFPRTGSTWTQEIIWLLANNLDYEGAKEAQVTRCPFIEMTAILYEDHREWLTSNTVGNSVQNIENLSSPRFIKSHLPNQFLPKELDKIKPKIIYIARNPKDVCVSYYHYCMLAHGLKGSFDDFANQFISDKLPMCPMWPHMLHFWNKRNEPNVLYLKYEDINNDLYGTIERCAKFLNVYDKISKEDIQKLYDYVQFDEMQKNRAVNVEEIIFANAEKHLIDKKPVKFIRNGKIGDWKNYMSTELSNRFDEWINVNTKDTGLLFEYE